jgi:FMN reductase
MRTKRPFVVGVGGTLRDGSTSERALRVALSVAEAIGATTRLFAGPAINIDPYDPAVPERSSDARALVDALRKADGVIVSSPGYHGSVSGLLKNAIDYTEDLRTDARPYLSERAVGIIVCADGIQAMGSTLNTLRSITHALRGWPTPFAAAVNSSSKPFTSDGQCKSTEVEQSLRLVAAEVVEFAQMKIAADQGESARSKNSRSQLSSAELSERMAAMEMTFRLMG